MPSAYHTPLRHVRMTQVFFLIFLLFYYLGLCVVVSVEV
jgi:hypothetical protein